MEALELLLFAASCLKANAVKFIQEQISINEIKGFCQVNKNGACEFTIICSRWHWLDLNAALL
ncbi:hypothetical protein NQZ68_014542 [Dissostichus eleginoides]|nr:hypothetical protein NQZ68_014542 [Dissostichus eleginoides]